MGYNTELDLFGDHWNQFGLIPRKLVVNVKHFWSPKEGENAIIILPPTDEFKNRKLVWKDFGIVIYHHPNMIPEGGSFPCLKLMKGESCPFCETWAKLSDRREKNIYQPKMSGAIWVVDVSSRETQMEGAKLWLFGWTKDTFLAIKDALIDPETGKAHPILEDPRILYFRGEEEGHGRFKNIKIVTPRLGSRPIDKEVFEKFKAQVRSFDEIINWPTQEELAPFYEKMNTNEMYEESEMENVTDDSLFSEDETL